MIRREEKKNKNILFLIILLRLLFVFVQPVSAEEPNIHHLEGEALKKKMVYVQNSKIVKGYQPKKVSGSDPSGNMYSGYFYPLTPNERDRTGAVYLEDRLDLNYAFKMTGYLNFEIMDSYYHLYHRYQTPADGMGVIFHGDDNKFVGHYGSSLGIRGLENAVGLAVDIYHNGDQGDPKFERSRYVNKEWHTYTNPYTRIWYSLGEYVHGYGDQAIEVDRQVIFNKHYTKVDMEYNPKTRELTYVIHFPKADEGYPGGSRVHVYKITDYLDYVYFSATASTGGSVAGQNFIAESIDYVPYRTRKVVYRENETIVKPPNGYPTEVTGFVGEKYELEATAPAGYEVVNVQGKLKGEFKLDEVIDDQVIYVNLRKVKTTSSYTFQFNTTDFLRKDKENQDSQLWLSPSSPTVLRSTSTDKIKYISVESPKGINITSETFPSGIAKSDWHKVVYEADEKIITQYFLDKEEAAGVSDTNSMTVTQANTFIKNINYSIDQNLEMDSLDDSQIVFKVDSRPILKYKKNGIESYFKVVNHYGRADVLNKAAISSEEADWQARAFGYRGLKGEAASSKDADELQFIEQLISTDNADKYAWIARGNIVTGGNTVPPNPDTINRHIVKYSRQNNQSLTGVEESSYATLNPNIPQPVIGTYEDDRGNIINGMVNEYLTTAEYRINQTLMSTKANVKKIEGFNFIKLDGNQTFPIRATSKSQPITFVYESIYPYLQVNYLQLNKTGSETNFQVYENLEDKIKKKPDGNHVKPGTSISSVVSKKEFEGYKIDETKTSITTISGKVIINDIMPEKEDVIVNLYYTPMAEITVPGTLDFGAKNKGEKDSLISLEDKDLKINILNTFESDGWELTARSNGMKSEEGVYLLADILFKEDGKNKIINGNTEAISDTKNELKSEIPLSSADGKDGIYIQLLKNESATQYKGSIKFSFQNVP